MGSKNSLACWSEGIQCAALFCLIPGGVVIAGAKREYPTLSDMAASASHCSALMTLLMVKASPPLPISISLICGGVVGAAVEKHLSDSGSDPLSV